MRDQSLLRCQHHGLRPGADAEFAIHGFKMGLDRGHADIEVKGDPFVGTSGGEQLQYLAFTHGEMAARQQLPGARRRFLIEVAQSLPQRLQCRLQFSRPAALRQIAVHAGRHRSAHIAFAAALAHDQDTFAAQRGVWQACHSV
jgi:hypothetical protein